MCGIGGIARAGARGVHAAVLLRMAKQLRHRGPDAQGILPGARVGLAHTRLSIIDLAHGAQPLGNEDGKVVITYNGEVYNYLELRARLAAKGHAFRTDSDTEVLVHAYEEWGEAMLAQLNGQFAFAIYDQRDESVFVARDRFGICPLYYAMQRGDFLFASEAKAIFATGEIQARPDLHGLDEVFTLWAARAPRTTFDGIRSLEPGSCAVWRDGVLRVSTYYEPRFTEAAAEPRGGLFTLDELLRSAVVLRMRADVPVGAYLSGGLDSSITSALAAAASPHDLRTFSVTFDDPALDESAYQTTVAGAIRSRHAIVRIGRREIADVFPAVVEHAETPLIRTAPAPMYLLSRLTRDCGIKVVLTGEGADELFLGYDLFKEVAVRLFCLRQPRSRLRPRLFGRLYPYLGVDPARAGEFWQRTFLDAGGTEDPLFSHMPRFALATRIKDFYSDDMRAALAGADALAELRASLPREFAHWSPLHRAAYLEMRTLLPSYLLASQGDRMSMSHGVEARFPFLDHRLFEFAASLPARSKLRGLHEKDILRRCARAIVPPAVVQRPKQPYRAPDAAAFFAGQRVEYADELLSPGAIRASGYFDARAVEGLVRRCRAGRASGFAENQAMVAILSTQLWHRRFIEQATPMSLDSGPAALWTGAALADVVPHGDPQLVTARGRVATNSLSPHAERGLP